MKMIRHFGVYGVCIREEKLLCIHKNRGPYINRYDLPGGSQNPEESLVATLNREILEETGFKILELNFFGVYDFFIKNLKENIDIHHIGIMYLIDIDESIEVEEIINELDNERNDSIGKEWVSFQHINENNSSPLVLKIKEITMNESQTSFDADIYNEWLIKI